MFYHNKRILLICSAGGHLTQMLKINSIMGDYQRILITERTPSTEMIPPEDFFKLSYLPHGGREEGLKYTLKFSFNLLLSLIYYLKYRPKVVVSTGAHTALPTMLIAKLFRSKIIFIETFAKINTPSLTGRLIYHFSDSFYIQWPELQIFYPKAKYKGRIY